MSLVKEANNHCKALFDPKRRIVELSVVVFLFVRFLFHLLLLLCFFFALCYLLNCFVSTNEVDVSLECRYECNRCRSFVFRCKISYSVVVLFLDCGILNIRL